MCATQRLAGFATWTIKMASVCVPRFIFCNFFALSDVAPAAKTGPRFTHVLGIRVGAEGDEREEQEVNFWLARCAEQDVPRVSAQKAKIERGRGAGREKAAGRTSAIVSVRKLSIQKTGRLYLLLSFPSTALWE